MANSTSRFSLPYPAEHQDPWYADFEAFALQVDAQLFNLHEQRNTVLLAGSLKWDGTSLVVVTGLKLVSPSLGGVGSVASAQSIALDDLEIAYLTMVPGASGAVTLAMGKSAALPANSLLKVLAYRSGTTLVLADGTVLASGETVVVGRARRRYRTSVRLALPQNGSEIYVDWTEERVRLLAVRVYHPQAPAIGGTKLYTLAVGIKKPNVAEYSALSGATYDLAVLGADALTSVPLTAVAADLDLPADTLVKIHSLCDDATSAGLPLNVALLYEVF